MTTKPSFRCKYYVFIPKFLSAVTIIRRVKNKAYYFCFFVFVFLFLFFVFCFVLFCFFFWRMIVALCPGFSARQRNYGC